MEIVFFVFAMFLSYLLWYFIPFLQNLSLGWYLFAASLGWITTGIIKTNLEEHGNE